MANLIGSRGRARGVNRLWPCLMTLAWLLAACGPAPAALPTARPQATLPLDTCDVSFPASAGTMQARCGKLQVYENRAAQSGRQISLNVVVIPAISRSAKPDALFFVPGGPGESGVESFRAVASAFWHIHQDRDIVLVDQRGTGGSNPLNCPADSSNDQSQAAVQAYLQSCLKSLNADPRFYTTSIAMDDLEQVRLGLGYESIDLYGGSYGTRAALVYLRQYPERVRSVILDGVAPPNWILGPDTSPNAQHALDLLFKRCSADADCQGAFPNLQKEFLALYEPLQKQPLPTIINDPSSGSVVTITMTASYFANTIFTMSYTAETVALLPLTIHSSYERKDYSLIAAQGLALSESSSQSISDGMRYSVLCAEDQPFFGQAAQDSGQGYLGNAFMTSLNQVCATWPRGQIPANFHDPVQSSIPVLLLSGEVDPVTPPQNAALAAQTLPNNLQIVANGEGHINILHGCLPKIAADFINQGSILGLDTSCVQDIQPEPFFLNFAGPRP